MLKITVISYDFDKFNNDMRTPQTNPTPLLCSQGHRRKNWKVRLFVLRSEPAFLHYFDPTKVSLQVILGPTKGYRIKQAKL